MTEPLLSVAQVARMVGVPLSCAGRWVESGLLPSEAPNEVQTHLTSVGVVRVELLGISNGELT
jgi:hypothetical protein